METLDDAQGAGDGSGDEAAAAPPLDVLVERDAGGGWVLTPLSGAAALEVRPPLASGTPPPGARGVIWRLDDEVFSALEGGPAPAPAGEDAADLARLALAVPERLERAAADVERLSALADRLKAKLSHFQDDLRHLEEREAEAEKQQADLQERSSRLEEDRERFNSQVSDAADHISRAIRAPVRAGEVASQPPDVFFVAAQDEFARAVPPLDADDEAELRHAKLTPEAAFLAAKEAFFGPAVEGAAVGGEAAAAVSRQMRERVAAVAKALLALQCLDETQAPSRFARTLEQLLSIVQALARLANNSGHLPLAFAASGCATWCASRLSEHLGPRWEEAQPEELLRESDTPAAQAALASDGQLLQRARSLAQFGKVAQRLLRAWSEHPDHRRRFLRFMANKGIQSATEADMRLLFLSREAAPAELAAHLRRLSGLADKNVVLVPSRRKRPRPAEAPRAGVAAPRHGP